MDKSMLHEGICLELAATYKAKNSDYGDSFAKVRKEYPEAIVIRLMDKLERLKTLLNGNEQKVNDESIEDTLKDLANYCIMECVEREIDKETKTTPDPEKVQAVVDELMKPVSDEVAKHNAEHFWQR